MELDGTVELNKKCWNRLEVWKFGADWYFEAGDGTNGVGGAGEFLRGGAGEFLRGGAGLLSARRAGFESSCWLS